MFRLDQFMRVCLDDVALPDGRKITIRTLSELENNARHDYGVAEAMRVSEALKNHESDLYKVKILPLYDATLESIQNLVSQGRVMELVREANDLYPMDFVPIPDSPTLAEEVSAAEGQMKVESDTYTARAKHILNGVNSYKDKLAELPKDALMREIELRAQQVYSSSYQRDAEMYYTVWCSTEIGGKRVWKNPEEVQNLPGQLVTFLYDKYTEVDAVDPWEVTKSVPKGNVGGVGENRSDQPAIAG